MVEDLVVKDQILAYVTRDGKVLYFKNSLKFQDLFVKLQIVL